MNAIVEKWSIMNFANLDTVALVGKATMAMNKA
jgi:hypothetical protein